MITVLDRALQELLHDDKLSPGELVDIIFLERALSLPWWLRRVREAGGVCEAIVDAIVEYF